MKIVDLHREDTTLKLVFAAGPSLEVPLLWLRDHCPCPDCLRPDTRQRRLDTFALDAEPQPRALELVGEGAALAVTWEDHQSLYPSASLLDARVAQPRARPWLATQARAAARAHDHDAIMTSDRALLDWLETIEEQGFALVRGVPLDVEATGRLAERVGYIRASIFGRLWSFTADLDHSDTAYTREALALHTDGTYCHDAPGLQVLHCLEFTGEGGHSLLADGLRAAAELRRVDPQAFDVLAHVEVCGRYVEPGVDLRSSRPILRLDSAGQVRQVSFNNSDRAPLRLPAPELQQFYRALRAFHDLITRPEAVLRLRLEPGTLVIIDNWRVLHGREAFSGSRRLCGCYLNREDFESRLRVLRADLQREAPNERQTATC